ncbi:hypothetical protein Q6D67_02170 [Haliea sp. E1-2-M8]|uniref:hypothetical protein n=1 Tax=Haliea sp. E1-2-M8 TaxID=3064706 RepID=UPI0027205B1F|nr:hypothetical protein [Haliea sp. E1-2-M8]MDO8860491.1 hypothetical protein [Haliea sp. E1-2-M8]
MIVLLVLLVLLDLSLRPALFSLAPLLARMHQHRKAAIRRPFHAFCPDQWKKENLADYRTRLSAISVCESLTHTATAVPVYCSPKSVSVAGAASGAFSSPFHIHTLHMRSVPQAAWPASRQIESPASGVQITSATSELRSFKTHSAGIRPL